MDQSHLSTLRDALRFIAHSMDVHSRQLQKQVGVTGPQLSILQTLADESPLPLSKISKQIHLSVATISSTTARLAERGLIQRKKGAGDKRQVLLSLTDKGQKVLNSGSSPLPDNLIRNFSNGLPDWEKSMIIYALLKLTQLIGKNGDGS